MNRKNNPIILLFVCTIVVTLIIFNFFLNTNSVRGASNPPIKSYMTISVESNDTLWDLADQYMNSAYYDHKSFISEVIAINNIKNATIFSGDNLTLPVVE